MVRHPHKPKSQIHPNSSLSQIQQLGVAPCKTLSKRFISNLKQRTKGQIQSAAKHKPKRELSHKFAPNTKTAALQILIVVTHTGSLFATYTREL